MVGKRWNTSWGETTDDAQDRFVRVLWADVAWWRENASRVSDVDTRDTALSIAAGLEEIASGLRIKWRTK